MIGSKIKATIIADPDLGCILGYTLILISDLREIALIDLQGGYRAGHKLDLEISGAGLDRDVYLELGSDLELAQDSSLVIWGKGAGKSITLLEDEIASQIKKLIPELNELCLDPIFLVAAHPSDLIVYLIWKLGGIPRSRVMGIESSHGSMALAHSIRDRIGVRRNALIMGFSSQSLFPLKSSLDTFIHWGELMDDLNRNLEELKQIGAKYSRAICTGILAKSILEDLKQEFSVSAVLEGEYGLRDIALGVPALIGAGGVEMILEYQLDQQELDWLRKAEAGFRNLISRFNLG